MIKGNITEIAEAAGVSLATVSRVFSNHPNVRMETRKKILAAARRLNYAPKIAAGKRTIGLVVESLENLHRDFHLVTMLSITAQQLALRNCGLELLPMAQIDRLQEHFVRAAIAIPYSQKCRNLLLRQKYAKIIFLNQLADGVTCVCVDHRAGARLACDHLASYGHRRFALLLDYTSGWGNAERRAGFIEARQRLGDGDSAEELIHTARNGAIADTLRKILAQGCTGLIVSSESITLEVAGELQRLGLRVPGDLSVISYEYDSVSRHLCPAHTTIDQNPVQLVTQAVDTAVRMLDGEKNPVRIFVENRLIPRESVATPGV